MSVAIWFRKCFYQVAGIIAPNNPKILNNWGIVLYDQAMINKGAEADELFKQACEKYVKTIAIKPDDYRAYNNWGNAAHMRAKIKSGADGDAFYKLALQRRFTLLRRFDYYYDVLRRGVFFERWRSFF